MSYLGGASIARIGLIQACLGSILVLTTSTLNRVLVVELALPALRSGFLVAFRYVVQITFPSGIFPQEDLTRPERAGEPIQSR